MKSFLISGGSVPGSDHRQPLTQSNCQDAFGITDLDDLIVAVVCDGSGSQPNSEIGAKLGVQLLSNVLQNQLRRADGHLSQADNPDQAGAVLFQALRRSELDMLSHIRVLANAMTPADGSLSKTIQRNFLFTLVGLAVTKRWATVFYVGDGVYAINGEVSTLGPFPENKPPYPSYQLIGSDDFASDSQLIQLRLAAVLPTEEITSILIGTDGVDHLISAEESKLPGRKDKVGPVRQFWEQKQFVENSDAVRRRLALITQNAVFLDTSKGSSPHLTTETGLLKDDTTIVVLQRS